MDPQDFTERAPALASTLALLFQHQDASLEAKLLKTGVPELMHIEHDNWNGGIDTFSFVLRVPVDLFAKLGKEQEHSILAHPSMVLVCSDLEWEPTSPVSSDCSNIDNPLRAERILIGSSLNVSTSK